MIEPEKAPRELCSSWASKTFGQAVEDTFWKETSILTELKKQLTKLGIHDKPINGYSVQGLQKTHEGGGIGISYTETFFEVMKETGSCHPIDYLYLLVKNAVSKQCRSDDITGILARSMRTFASLLRDMDFAVGIKREIDKQSLSETFTVSRDPTEDSVKHTDVLIMNGGNAYRIWLFQYSRMGLPHDIERITGVRGSLPTGTHVLCPLKSETAMEYENVIRKINRVTRRVKMVNEKIGEMNEGTKAAETLKIRKNFYDAQLKEFIEMEKTLSAEIKGEVLILEGWYFYSIYKIRSVLEEIKEISNGTKKPKIYSEVCEILNAPKIYLSKTSSFII